MDMAPARDDVELDELERVRDLLDDAHGRLRSLLDLLAMIGIRAEHSPDGWLVIDERIEGALQLPAA